MSHRSQAELAQSFLVGGLSQARASHPAVHRQHQVQLVRSADSLIPCGSSPAFYPHVSVPRRREEHSMPLDELLQLAIGGVLTRSINNCGCSQPCGNCS